MTDLKRSEVVWSKLFDFKEFKELFPVQEKISIAILEQLRIKATESQFPEWTTFKTLVGLIELFSKEYDKACSRIPKTDKGGKRPFRFSLRQSGYSFLWESRGCNRKL